MGKLRVWTLIVFVVPGLAQAQSTDLCAGLIRDKLPHPMTPLAKPALGKTVTDPEFGTTIRRISAVSNDKPVRAIRPMYSTTSAWNADESLLILYEVGVGHRLHDGRNYDFIRYLNIAPSDLEQVYWHTSDPDVFHYVDAKGIVRYHVSSGFQERLRTFDFCQGPVSADSHAFTSWNSTTVGLRCDNEVFLYDIGRDRVTGIGTSPLDAPMAASSGDLAYFHGLVLDRSLRVLRYLDLSEPDTHSSLGRTASGRDVFNGALYDPGPSGSDVGTLVTHDLKNGSSKVIVGPATGYPYPPSGTHISSLAYRQPGWVFASVIGDPDGQGILDNELLIANIDTGAVCRIAHHRSWGKNNTKLAIPYWAEPHVVPSPSGTRALFASDWGNGAKVDAYVVELPSYTQDAPQLRLTLAANASSYRAGDLMSIGLGVENAASNPSTEIYFLVLVPGGGDIIVLFTGSGFEMEVGRLSQPAAWSPLPNPQSLLPAVFRHRWTAASPAGRYVFVLVATRAGALADNRFDAGDVIDAATAVISFRP